MRDIIDTLEGKESIENRAMQAEECVKTAERDPCIIKNALHEIGATTTTEDLSYDKLLFQAYLDKWEQRFQRFHLSRATLFCDFWQKLTECNDSAFLSIEGDF